MWVKPDQQFNQRFKTLLYKFLKKCPLLKKYNLQSSYFKNSFNAIKVVCKTQVLLDRYLKLY